MRLWHAHENPNVGFYHEPYVYWMVFVGIPILLGFLSIRFYRCVRYDDLTGSGQHLLYIFITMLNMISMISLGITVLYQLTPKVRE